MGLGMWMTSCPEVMDFGWILGDFWKKADSWDLNLEEASGFFLIWTRPGQLVLRDAQCVVGSDGTVSIVRIVSLSPRVENLKVKKVIKVLYLNYRESSVFRVFFEFLCLGTFYVLYISIYLYSCIMAIQHI